MTKRDVWIASPTARNDEKDTAYKLARNDEEDINCQSSLRGAKRRSNPEEKNMNEHVSYVYIMFHFRNGTL